MSDRQRRAAVALAALAFTFALAVRVAACGGDDQTVRDSGPRWEATAPAIPPRAHALDTGERTERSAIRAPLIPPAVAARARSAIAVYKARERRAQPRWALPALRPLILAPTGRARWRATAITGHGELYLIVDLEQTRRGVIVTGWR